MTCTPPATLTSWSAPRAARFRDRSAMNVGIYCEPHGGSPGGAEFCVAALAESLRRSHKVEIVQHRPDLTIDHLSRMFGSELDGCNVRYLPYEWPGYYGPSKPWRHVREARRWQADLSEPDHLFVNFTHRLPPFCHARIGVLVILFPWFDRREEGPCRLVGHTLRARLRRIYAEWEWRQRFATYQAKVATSAFSRDYARKWWDLDCEVVYPPAGGDFERADKTATILSVGRFATLGHSKKQLEMVAAFRRLESAGLSGWEVLFSRWTRQLERGCRVLPQRQARSRWRARLRAGQSRAHAAAATVRAIEDLLACGGIR